MAQSKVAQPIEKIKAVAEGAARAQTSPPEVRLARAIFIRSALVVLAVAFTVLTVFVKLTVSLPIDLRVTHYLQTSHVPLFRSAMIVVSWAGNSPQSALLVGVMALLLYVFGLHWEALMSVVAAVGVTGINIALKVAIHRPRPTADLVDVFSDVGGYSFPSGHVMFYVGYFGFLWFLAFSLLKDSPRRTVALVALGVLLVLVGASRIYLGAHWASDVVGAYLLGLVVLAGIVHVYRWGKTRFFVHQPVAPAPAKA